MMAVQMNFAEEEEEEEQRPWTKSKIMNRFSCCRSVAAALPTREIGRLRVCFPDQVVVVVTGRSSSGDLRQVHKRKSICLVGGIFRSQGYNQQQAEECTEARRRIKANNNTSTSG
jgi:hypothetical protein